MGKLSKAEQTRFCPAAMVSCLALCGPGDAGVIENVARQSFAYVVAWHALFHAADSSRNSRADAASVLQNGRRNHHTQHQAQET